MRAGWLEAKRATDVVTVAIGAQCIEIGATRVEIAGARWSDALAAAVAAHARTPGARVHATVSERWLACAPLPWSDALRGAGAEAFAAAQLEAGGFDVEPGAVVRLDDAPFGAPRLAVAYPAALVGALEQAAPKLGATLASVLPLGVAAWLGARARGQALAVLDAGFLTLLHGDAGRIEHVSVRATEPAWHAVRAQWRRAQLRDVRLGACDRLAVLDLAGALAPTDDPALHRVGPARAARAPRSALNAVDAPPRAGAKPWLAAALAAGVAGVLVLQAWQAHGELQSRLARAQQPVPPATPDAAPWTRADLARVQSVNGAIRELNLPIEALLAALQPPRDVRVAVLGVDVLGSQPASASTVRIAAEASSGADMARYVAFVSERKPFSGAYLTRHEVDEAAPDRPYRFTLEATWRD